MTRCDLIWLNITWREEMLWCDPWCYLTWRDEMCCDMMWRDLTLTRFDAREITIKRKIMTGGEEEMKPVWLSCRGEGRGPGLFRRCPVCASLLPPRGRAVGKKTKTMISALKITMTVAEIGKMTTLMAINFELKGWQWFWKWLWRWQTWRSAYSHATWVSFSGQDWTLYQISSKL